MLANILHTSPLLPQFPPAFHRGLMALLRSLTQTRTLSPRPVLKIGYSTPAPSKGEELSPNPKTVIICFLWVQRQPVPHSHSTSFCSLPVCPFSPPQPLVITLTSTIYFVQQDCSKAFSRPLSLGSCTYCQAGQSDQQGLETSTGFPLAHRKPAKPTQWAQISHI